MYKAEEIKTAETFVKTVLRDCPETRGSDKKLLIETWERQGLHLTPEQVNIFMKCLPAETITRARREVQAAGWYRPSEGVQQFRMFAHEDVKKNL